MIDNRNTGISKPFKKALIAVLPSNILAPTILTTEQHGRCSFTVSWRQTNGEDEKIIGGDAIYVDGTFMVTIYQGVVAEILPGPRLILKEEGDDWVATLQKSTN